MTTDSVPATAQGIIASIRAERLVPVLRAGSDGELLRQLDCCIEAGLRVVELTTTSPGWIEQLRRIRRDPAWSEITVGVGTIVRIEDAVEALDAGAAFLVSPYPVPSIRAEMDPSVLLIEGGLTPAELADASRRNSIAKIFPASSVGPAHLRALRDVLPGVDFMPTGGVTASDARDWLAAGAIAVGMGSSLFRMATADIRRLREELSSI